MFLTSLKHYLGFTIWVVCYDKKHAISRKFVQIESICRIALSQPVFVINTFGRKLKTVQMLVRGLSACRLFSDSSNICLTDHLKFCLYIQNLLLFCVLNAKSPINDPVTRRITNTIVGPTLQPRTSARIETLHQGVSPQGSSIANIWCFSKYHKIPVLFT